MSKGHRGRGIDELVRKGRGACPVCKRTGIKLLYEHTEDEKKMMICKQCRARFTNQRAKEKAASE